MKLTLNTIMFDTSVALAGYRFYQKGEYSEAIPVLQDLLDIEPRNWYARLLLGASFLKTGQPMSADRAFRFVYESCDDHEIKQKACLALQATRAHVDRSQMDIPAEFGMMVDRILPPGAKIEAIIT